MGPRGCGTQERGGVGKGDGAFQLPATTHGNVAILAMRPPAPSVLRLDRLAAEADKLTAQCNIEFDAFVSRLKAENPHTAQRLLPRQ